MLIVLPDEETSTENLAKRLEGLDFTNIRTDEEPTETYISIPKFELMFKTDLKEHMVQLGVRDLFSEASADLSGISNEHLFASKGVHQALIEVNEEGTEAAAATAAIVLQESVPPRWFIARWFIADRPFLFIVYDFEHKTTLFAGKVADPNNAGVVQSWAISIQVPELQIFGCPETFLGAIQNVKKCWINLFYIPWVYGYDFIKNMLHLK